MVHLNLSRIAPFVCLVALIAAPVWSSTDDARNDLGYLEGLSLFVLETNDIPSLHAARNLIHSYGGRIAIMSPPSLLIGWFPFELRQELIGQAGITDIYFTEVLPGEVALEDKPSQRMVQFYNAAVRGEIQADYEQFTQSQPANRREQRRQQDAFEAPALDYDEYLENLRNVGLNVASLKDRGLLIEPTTEETMGNSDAMTGTVALTIFFLESDGSGSDPNLYTWAPEHLQNYINRVAAALAFWSTEASHHIGCSASFLINYYSGADPRCQQWVEPILHSSSWEDTWVKNVMSNFGYTSGTRFSRVNAFNTWQRSYFQTDRSYSAFVPYNPSPAASSFPDGATAYAWYGGPYTVLLYRVQGWSATEVFAHETGHIFYACDEYAGGCSSCSATCGNGVANENCEACNPNSRDCMMKANSFHLCAYTPGQVGWALTPCSPPPPPPLPTPGVSVSYPTHGLQGVQTTITVGGTNFFPGSAVDFGDDVFVDITTLVGAESLIVDVSVFNAATPGFRDITVRNRDGQTATLTDAFEIRPTTRHYFSPTGGNIFPYITPGDAATSLEDALDVAYDGDTLFVPTMTFDDIRIDIFSGVLLHGAWNSTFTQRDIVNGKTVVNLNGNVQIAPGANGAGLDGFIIRNGKGNPGLIPFNGFFGGAIQVLGADVTIANCEILLSAASDGAEYGVGGGIFVRNSTVDIRDNNIHDNTATQGAGIYLYECTGSITNNTVSQNTVTLAAPPSQGAGIMVVNCSDIVASGNMIDGNTGADSGGGVRIENSTGISLSGGVISNNTADFNASSTGGGIIVDGSTVSLSQIEFSGNVSNQIGGAVVCLPTADLTMADCLVTGNSSLLGGGVYASGGTLTLNHNLFVNNNATASGGAVFLSGLSGGAVVGNTIDQNTSSGVGGAQISSSAIEFYNNIITNSTGMGLSCSVGLTSSFNLVWNNSGGDYAGCAAGTGDISADPLFSDAGNMDYHLALHSPAIDAGRPGASYEDLDGSRGDLGWHGSQALPMAQPSYPKTLTANAASGNVELAWTQNPEGDVTSYAVYCDTTFGFAPSIDNFVTLVAGTDSTVTVGAPGDSAFYRISALDASGYGSGYSNVATTSPPTAIGDDIVQYRFGLHQNVPNPFNPVTRIAYDLHSRAAVTLNVYDVDGRLVKRLVGGVQEPGRYSAEWKGEDGRGGRVASGVYFYRLEAGALTKTRKMVLLK